MNSLFVITNAEAGSNDEESVEAAVEVLSKGTDVQVAATSNPGELDGALQRAGSRTIVVAGGDGSLHAVVAQLHKRNELAGKTIGLIPLGTGNDFARTLDLPLDPVEAARVIQRNRTRDMDLIVDELGDVVVNNVHVGASAMASRKGATWKARLGKFGIGILGYPVGAVQAAIRPPFIRLRVEIDGEVVSDVDRHVLMLAVGNGASVGGGTEVTPEADPGDGNADVMISYATGPLSRFGFVAALRRGEHDERDDTSYFRGSQVRIAGEDFWLSADGEISGPERRRSWRVEAAAYRMLVP